MNRHFIRPLANTEKNKADQTIGTSVKVDVPLKKGKLPNWTKPVAAGAKAYADKYQTENKSNLLEVEYEKIFKPETLATLKGKSGESLRQMVGDKDLMRIMMESQQLVSAIARVEAPHKDLLEQLAIELVTKAYPIIDYANIEIDAKIVYDLGANNVPPDDEDDDQQTPGGEEAATEEDEKDFDVEKRRVINGITQGAAIRGSFGYMLFREYVDAIDETLVDKYGKILKLAFGMYDSDEAIAMMLMLLSQGNKIEGGSSKAEYVPPSKEEKPEEEPANYDAEEDEYQEPEDDEQSGVSNDGGHFKITARALNFPILVHEIVKGLYEILSLQGFNPEDVERNIDIHKKADLVKHEPEDLRYGKFIYDAINDLFINSDVEDPRVRDLLFTEIYKLGGQEFLSFIENIVNGKLTPQQQRWATNAMREINSDLKKDDTGLDNLNERVNAALKKNILLEVSIDQLKTQFVDTGKVSPDAFKEIVDNLGNKSAYATWITKKVADKLIKTEDIYKWKGYFDVFDRNKKEFEHKDINHVKNTNDLVNFIHKATEIKNREKQDPSQQKGVSKDDKYKEFHIGDVDGFKVYEIPKGRKDLYNVSCELGSGTEWCTATGNTRNHFDNYISKDSLFIFVKGDEKYQFHYADGQFMDKNDNPVF